MRRKLTDDRESDLMIEAGPPSFNDENYQQSINGNLLFEQLEDISLDDEDFKDLKPDFFTIDDMEVPKLE
jgi:hypothetical protein